MQYAARFAITCFARACLLGFAVSLTLLSGCGGSKVKEFTASNASLATDLPPLQFVDTDWPYWRGTNLTNQGVGPFPFDGSALKSIWKQDLPISGHASPIVVGKVVYVAGAQPAKSLQHLAAFDRETGKPLWQTKLHEGGKMKIHPKNSHASATPACDGNNLFAVCMVHDAIWLSSVSVAGELQWQKEVGPFRSMHGYGSSPVLYKSLVIVAGDSSAGGFLAALHRETGDIVWRVRRSNSPSFCSPVVAQLNGQEQLLMSGHNKVHSYDPATGKKLWSSRGPAKTTANTLVWHKGLVFASGGYPENRIMAIQADGTGKMAWENKKKIYVPSMLVTNSCLFAIQDNGVAHCYDPQTGAALWTKRLGGPFSSSPVLADGNIFATSEGGDISVFAAADKYQLIGKHSLDDACFSTPVIAGGRMYVRTENQLHCLAAE